jgi:Mg-chelatase subunit ChlD
MSAIGTDTMGGSFEMPGMRGGRRRGSRKGKGKGRGRKGGSFLAEITVPAALLAATQYMKGPSSYRRTKRRGSRRRNRSSQRRRRR